MNWKWLRHAFAIEPPGPAEPTPAERAIVERVCAEVVRRRMTAPALLFLESCRPLNFVGGQALQFFAPLLSAITYGENPTRFAAFLERRGSIEYLCRRIQELDTADESP